MKKALLVGFMVMLAVCLMTPGVQAEKKFLRMVSGPQGGSWYPLGAAMMSIVRKTSALALPMLREVVWAIVKRSMRAGPMWVGVTHTPLLMPMKDEGNSRKKTAIFVI